jgi:hypothetical protein
MPDLFTVSCITSIASPRAIQLPHWKYAPWQIKSAQCISTGTLRAQFHGARVA